MHMHRKDNLEGGMIPCWTITALYGPNIIRYINLFRFRYFMPSSSLLPNQKCQTRSLLLVLDRPLIKIFYPKEVLKQGLEILQTMSTLLQLYFRPAHLHLMYHPLFCLQLLFRKLILMPLQLLQMISSLRQLYFNLALLPLIRIPLRCLFFLFRKLMLMLRRILQTVPSLQAHHLEPKFLPLICKYPPYLLLLVLKLAPMPPKIL